MYDNDIINQIVAYESGELDHDQTVALFAELRRTGLIFKLQGSYQRSCQQFIETGELSHEN